MARITIDDCVDKVENQFDLTLLASKRAYQLFEGSEPKIKNGTDKAVVVSLREIAASLTTKETIEQEDKVIIEASRALAEISPDRHNDSFQSDIRAERN